MPHELWMDRKKPTHSTSNNKKKCKKERKLFIRPVLIRVAYFSWIKQLVTVWYFFHYLHFYKCSSSILLCFFIFIQGRLYSNICSDYVSWIFKDIFIRVLLERNFEGKKVNFIGNLSDVFIGLGYFASMCMSCNNGL